MSLRTRRGLVLIGVLAIAGILAFSLRNMIYDAVVIPTAFIVWNLGLLYRSFSQGLWWWLLVALVLLMLAFSLIPPSTLRRRVEQKRKSPQGQVEALAVWLQKTEHGLYFKWMVANRLGKLAYRILLQRENGRPRSVFAPLRGDGWEPAQELQNYLEVGLHGSFAEFPNRRRPFGPRQTTPLDLEIAEAVEFLEAQLTTPDERG